MAEIVSLADGVATVVRNGDTVAMEGFTHLIPFAAGHEVIRQGRRDLTLVRMTPDVIYDQLIGAGCARRLVFSWGGNPGVGSLHRFRDAVQQGWPVPLAVEEHSHAGMANRYVAGASRLPFAVLRGYVGTDLPSQTESIKPITCPFTGEVLTAVPALRPDAAVVHAQRADRAGNVQLWGIIGVHKEAVLASSRSLVTIEEIVEKLDPRLRHSRRTLVERVDFVTSVGYGTGPGERERLGLTGAGPRLVITDLGILEPDPDSCELTLTRLHPGASLDKARQATGWPLAVAGDLTTTGPPSQQELEVLRRLEGSMA
jgi:glutaconate CoA-transferase, subunit A